MGRIRRLGNSSALSTLRKTAHRAGVRAGQSLYRTNSRHVFYNSFAAQYSDSPRAIFEELSRRDTDLTHIWRAWSADSARMRGFPPDVPRVYLGTWSHARALAEAGYVVSNTWMPNNAKTHGTVWLQTWHGTPLKRIAFDRAEGLSKETHRTARRDVKKWDYLVSPNAFSTEIFRHAFRYDGEIIETGYPRNDVLSAPDRDAIRSRVRTELGIADGQTAVLYAPTFRDTDAKGPDGRRQFTIPLDIEAMERELGEDHVLLLRLHRGIAPQAADEVGQSFAQNVTFYPDIRDLYLAADVMVTDYSSVMFDFAITGKPMLFFAHDLDSYRDGVRGFYFDFEREAPGPIVANMDELLACLQSPDDTSERYSERYQAFTHKFCSLEDGHATERVVNAVFDGQAPG